MERKGAENEQLSERAAKAPETKDSAFPITVYHNPACGTSRDTLARIRTAGYAPTVVEYLKAGWTRPQLESLFKAMGVRPREALREKGSPAAGARFAGARRHG